MKSKYIYLLPFLTASLTQAAVFSISSDGPADGVADSDFTVRGLTNETPRSGYTTSDDVGLAVVYVFEMPDLAGMAVSSVDLDFTLAFTASDPDFNADLYGLGYRESSDILGTDYYAGAYGDDPTDATPLVDDILIPSMGDDTSITLSNDSALLAYVNGQIVAGAGAGDYLFLRISPDYVSFPSGSDGYNVYSGDAPSNVPVLTLTTIPEPNAYASVAGMFALGILCLKRRKK